jgi:hypothetical protein
MITEHERAVLTVAVPDEGLEPGDVGTVVHIYRDGEAYEVEFVALDGHAAAVVTLEASQVRPISRREITHAREVRAVGS